MNEEVKHCINALERNIQMGFPLVGDMVEAAYARTIINLIESLSAQLDQVTRERDAAIRQQLEADKNNPFACNFCKHDEVCDGRLLACGDCDMDCPCNTCVNHDKWQWRGVEKEVEG